MRLRMAAAFGVGLGARADGSRGGERAVLVAAHAVGDRPHAEVWALEHTVFVAGPTKARMAARDRGEAAVRSHA